MSLHASRLIGRRAALGALAAAAWAIRKAPAATGSGLGPNGIDHVEFPVSNVEKSVAFYTRVFGNTVLKNNKTTRRYVKIGPGFLAMDKGPEMRVDHFCAGIQGFDVGAVHSYLAEHGIAYKDYPSGRDLYVSDPDGTRLQFGADNSWNQLTAGTASPEAMPDSEEPIFRSTGFDHILLHVSDPEKSEAFYTKVLGPVTQRNNNRTWFQAGKCRIGLLRLPAGQRPGVNHYCVSAAPFNYDAVMKRLEQAGAKLEEPEVKGAPEFRDPDGYLLQVMAPRQ